MRLVALSLSLLAIVWAAPQETSSEYLKPKRSTPPPNTLITDKPSEIVPPISDIGVNTKCTTEDGEIGECVPYYLCDIKKSIKTDGVIDIRHSLQNRVQVPTQCPSHMEVCCVLRDRTDSTDPITPAPGTLAEQEGCGWRKSNGVGFSIMSKEDGKSSFGEFPWMVAILRRERAFEDGQYINIYVGGGSLIHPSVVMTAAYLVAVWRQTNPMTTLRVRAGEWDTQTTKEIYPYQDRDVSSVVIHKDFYNGNLFPFENNIALLYLETPMEMAPNVGVVCLPPPNEIVRGGTKCLVSGWGKGKPEEEGHYQTILKKVQLAVVERQQCKNLFPTSYLGNFFKLHPSIMCPGGENGVGTCTGDEGSPLVCPIEFQKDRYMQSGILLLGYGCAVDESAEVYVNVSNLRSWIDFQIKGKGLDTKVYSNY